METVIYITNTDALLNRELFFRCYDAVEPERQRKTDRYYFDRDKRLSLGAGILLRGAMKDFGIEDPVFAAADNGKPFIANHPGFHYNLSHSGSVAICAVSDSEIGCDVEVIGEVHSDIARKFFSKEEYEALNDSKTEKEKTAVFYRIWTGKESYVKATGEGMACSLGSFSVLPGSVGEYGIKHFDFNDGYSYSVCRKGAFAQKEPVIKFEDISKFSLY